MNVARQLSDQEKTKFASQVNELKNELEIISEPFEKLSTHYQKTVAGSSSANNNNNHHNNVPSVLTEEQKKIEKLENKLHANEWWCYVYHDLSKQYRFNDENALNFNAQLGKMSFDVNKLDTLEDERESAKEEYMTIHVNKLKDNLRLQAIEISSLRQVSLEPLPPDLTYLYQTLF